MKAIQYEDHYHAHDLESQLKAANERIEKLEAALIQISGCANFTFLCKACCGRVKEALLAARSDEKALEGL